MAITAQSADDTIRVLFIEDDPAVAEMYKLKLELDGYQVTVVANDNQVLTETATVKPDMIFLDLGVGEDLGFATLQRLRATDSGRQVPVIILSRRGPHDMAGRGFKADALDYVVRSEPGPSGLAWNVADWARIEA
ncbi:MAG: response regulator transcription factor [Chloroflexi bacterium]|nr:MAG: response regulator transcription factor [Chloroflexota bacterium]